MASKKADSILEQLEKLLKEAHYVLRLEKGNFNSGFCVLEHRKVVVLNKFLDTEGKVDVLKELLNQLKIDTNRLSSDSKTFYNRMLEEERENVLKKIAKQEGGE